MWKNSEIKREKVLIEALPYIREFYGSIFVIKLGGNALIDEKRMEDIVQDIVLLRFVGINPIIVHGGGPEITRKMEKMGKKAEFIAGLRITDDETLEIAKMVLVGKINDRIVTLIGKHGGKGIGLSGKDGKLITARKKDLQKIIVDGVEKEIDLGWVGEVKCINPEILFIVVEKGYIPVISPIAVDDEGNSLNINADSVAGDIALSVGAKKLIILTDVEGLLMDVSDPSTLISKISLDEVKELMKRNVIHSGMIPKIQSGIKVVESGISCHIIDGRKPHSLLLELFSHEGIGTMIY